MENEYLNDVPDTGFTIFFFMNFSSLKLLHITILFENCTVYFREINLERMLFKWRVSRLFFSRSERIHFFKPCFCCFLVLVAGRVAEVSEFLMALLY